MNFLRCLCICLIVLTFSAAPLSAAKRTGVTPGNGGDSDPATFHFDPNNTDFQMSKADGTALTMAEVPILYGTEIKIFEDNLDYLTKNDIQAVGADLSGANWTNSNYPPLGQVAIDPATGRFKFSRTWTSAHEVSMDTGYDIQAQPEVVLNNNGLGFYAYYQFVNSTIRRTGVHKYANQSWSNGEFINPDDGYSGFAPRLAINDNDQAYCAFYQSDGSYNRIWVNQYAPTGSWIGAEVVSDANTGHAYFGGIPGVIAANNNSTVMVAWHQRLLNPNDRTLVNWRFQEGFWEGEELVDNGEPKTSGEALALNDSDKAHVLVKQYFGATTTPVIYANYYDYNQGGWQGATLLSPSGNAAGHPYLAVSNSGNAVGVYVYTGDGRLKAHLFDPGTETWGTSSNIDANGSNPFSNVDVDMDDLGNAICVFIQSDGSVNNVYANRYRAGAGWEGAVQIDNGWDQGVVGLAIDMNNSGDAAVAFNEFDGSQKFVYVNQYHIGSGWQGPERIQGSDINQGSVDVAMNNSNAILCAFTKYFTDDLTKRGYGAEYVSQIPGGTVLANYSMVDPATPLPSSPSVRVSNRKIMPLKGESATVQIDLVTSGQLKIKIYTLKGELVKVLRDGYTSAGSHTLTWAAENAQGALVASGVYMIHIQTPSQTETIKVVVVK